MNNPAEDVLEGEVTSIDQVKGVGTISLSRKPESSEVGNKELLFQVSDLVPGTEIADIFIGARVRLNAVMGENGARAGNITMAGSNHLEKQTSPTAACVERLSTSKPSLEKVKADAVIEEDRVMEKKEALKYLVLSATADGIDLDSLVITEMIMDNNGAVLKIEAKSTDEKTGNYKLVTYQIKRDQDIDETNVDVSSWDKDSEWPNSGDVMAKYVASQWQTFDNSKPKGQKWVLQQ